MVSNEARSNGLSLAMSTKVLRGDRRQDAMVGAR
jgi:hypothetical protein